RLSVTILSVSVITRTVSSPPSPLEGMAGLVAVMDDPSGALGSARRGAGRGPRRERPGMPAAPEDRSVVVAFACALAAGLERVAAAAGGGRVRVLDGESAPHQVFLVVDLGALQVAHAHRVHDDLDAVLLEDLVAFGDLVEDHPVLEPGAATSLDVDPEAA